jgi:hypothetical protein
MKIKFEWLCDAMLLVLADVVGPVSAQTSKTKLKDSYTYRGFIIIVRACAAFFLR